MKIIRTTGIILLAAVIMAGCKKKEEHNLPTVNLHTEEVNQGDSTVYGECVDAAMNSISVLTSNGDTIEYIFDAPGDDADVQGGVFLGDKMAIIGVKGEEENTAQKVINLTSLLGKWASLDKNFEIKDGKLRVVAMDGHRIGIRNTDLREEYKESNTIIPGKTLLEIS